MYGASLMFFTDEDSVIQKVEVKRYSKNELVSKFSFCIGSELIVKPLNKQKLKNRDRRVRILGFIEKNHNRVRVRYLDTNRNGIVDIDDLDAIE
ncbi:hypothetical protein [Rummeliibacillus suwonensis]|uniref:hypothetical protein n=1 Tax=Rummeliibacillus suwonensis TaxID=1306154 RepID=UPI00289B0DB9|nr:hypothetical protein [Rummeliibacillus suwonensis]